MKILLLALIMMVTGCQTISNALEKNDDGDKPRLEGKRISVLKYRSQLIVDAQHKHIPVQTPAMAPNKNWAGQNISPSNHLQFKEQLVNSQKISIGSGAENGLRLTSAPIVADGRVYVIDGAGVVSSYDASDLNNKIWEFTISQDDADSNFFGTGLGFGKERNDFLGGNIAHGEGKIFITTGRSKIIALGAQTGKVIWQRSVKLPVKTAPAYFGNRLYLITSTNILFVLDAQTGKTNWKHSGLQEVTSIYGAPSPIIYQDEDGEVVITPYSSGELYAFDAHTGKRLWGHMLSSSGGSKFASLLSLNDIDATPVIANGIVYAGSNDGKFLAINIRTGKVIWSQEIASINTPWVADKFLYLLTNNNEIICLDATSGAIKWVQQLRHNQDNSAWDIFGDDEGERILWNGPILAQNKLIITGSHGKMVFISPYNGAIVNVFAIEDDTYLPPIIADRALYILNNDANLVKMW